MFLILSTKELLPVSCEFFKFFHAPFTSPLPFVDYSHAIKISFQALRTFRIFMSENVIILRFEITLISK